MGAPGSIKGDNLLALKALEADYAGKVKCVFIDPPYNTGSAFEHYDDGVEHSIDRGAARLTGQQRHLAEEIARRKRGDVDLALVAFHADCREPFRKDEHRLARRTRGDDVAARRIEPERHAIDRHSRRQG